MRDGQVLTWFMYSSWSLMLRISLLMSHQTHTLYIHLELRRPHTMKLMHHSAYGITLLASYFGVTSIQTLYKYYNNRLLEPANWGSIIMHSVTGLLLFLGLWLGAPII